jgi:UDP-N-acetylglucosamine:LPS N-acetylglucosamine transferase
MKSFKIYLFVLLILCVGGFGAICIFQPGKSPSLIVEENGVKRPVRIMLFTCQYGSGHKMATQSIIESLPDCEIQVVDIYDQPLASLDPMRALAPEFSNERIYNELIKKEENQLLNMAGKIAPQFLLLQKKQIEKLLTRYVSKDKPDMLISCVPLMNFALLSTADKLDIPLLVITTDIDVSAFCFGFPEKLKENKTHFRMTVPYEQAELLDRRFPSLQTSFQYGFGYPTRRTFSEMPKQAVLNQLRDEYEIQKDENVILVMMGGNAGQASRAYADLLMQMDDEALDRIVGKENTRNKIHLICLCGDTSRAENKSFMESLNACNRSEGLSRVRIHGCPGTSKIGELVSLPELSVVISKPGGSTVNEMIKKKIPMIYHTNREPLDWERGNMEYGESRGLGKRFFLSSKPNSNDLTAFAELLAEMVALRKSMCSGKVPVPEANIDFTFNLRKTVKDMTSQTVRKPPATTQP